MNDDRLKALYRQLAATRDDVSSDDLIDAMGRHGYADVEDTALDRIATSTAHADILRTAMQLAPEAEALQRNVAALRQPRRTARPVLRRVMAVAATVAALAVLVTVQRGAETPVTSAVAPQPILSEDALFLSGSFESPRAPAMEIDEAQPIFRGDFDS
jgi:hypothetical protein